MRPHKLLVLVPLLLFATSCATVRLSSAERTALKVLQRYLALDRSGARLDTNRYHLIAPLCVWEDEPAWDSIAVSSGSIIGRPQESGDTVTVRVRYQVEGIMEADTFTPIGALDPEALAQWEIGGPVTFTLKSTPDGWKIASPRIAPRVGFPYARTFAKDAGAEATMHALDDAEYLAKLKGHRAGHCNCERLDF